MEVRSMEREELKNCKHITDHSCAFKGEPTIEDCLFCLPISAIAAYRRALMHLGANVKLPFSDAYMIYVEADSAGQKCAKFAELMEEHHPEIYKRGGPRMVAIIVRPNPLLDENPLTR